ncbi:PRC-barrel domain-containing protein [Halomonas sp. MCCC 1A17488]|uniref:PRC-barrel domain-containing protein n=1 Tax=unclassified Halomonas TaxID=2609666 RepID=UPI0018D20655|nr:MULTISPECIES: PRC-barrel domain-containing protein [unclassified Halomonas]MCE8016643.1 PRC-barrel domain-containing protein [Halomonas sp. MCCC 1A17488]MCG3239976.1 PRC-barrel domain-containing protein [Halomonas sp. MCCC 1A17488]QPP50133.1 PRC-barrel domain-containing protein [Halomonas sp. SS10-MC5]
MQKHLLTIAVAAVTGSLALGTQAIAQENDPKAAQGLYSADDVIGADVYHVDDSDEDVGDVENLLLDDEGKVSAVVVNAGGLWGIGGDEVVVGIEHFTLETERDDDDVSHRIMVDASEDELENFPEYNEEWFDDERNRRIDERGEREGVWQTTGTTGAGPVGDGAEVTEDDVEDDFE